MTKHEQEEWFFDQSIRIEKIIWLTGNAECDSISEQLEEFFEMDGECCVRLFGFDPEELGNEASREKLMRGQKFGFLVEASTPIPEYYESLTSYSCSWGYTQLKWFYVEEIGDELIKQLGDWHDALHQKKKDEAKKKFSKKANPEG